MENKPLILITNDDGISSPALRMLSDYLCSLDVVQKVFVVAPLLEQSGVGHAFTLLKPFACVKQKAWGVLAYALSGTPADCVKFANVELLKDEKIDRCKNIIVDCLGLKAELCGDDFAFVSNQPFSINASILNRSNEEITLESIQLSTAEIYTYNELIGINSPIIKELQSSGKIEVYNPYWLEKPFTNLF